MAVAYIVDLAGGTAAHYDSVMAKMALDGRLPPGALFHAAGPTDTGWRVCDVWETAEAFQEFAATQVGPLTAAEGLGAPAIRSFGVEQLRRGDAGPVGFAQLVWLEGLDAAGFAAMDEAICGPERELPAGCVLHVNGPAEGGWWVLDFWTSKPIRDAFLHSRVAPVAAARDFEGPPPIEDLPVHNSLSDPAASRVAVV
jgi:hypothetical protein